MVELREVNTERELKKFILFPFRLYRGNSCWVPPLLPDEKKTLRRNVNPAFEFCKARYWLAYKNGRVAGRIAGILNQRYIERWKNSYARFGWVDFVDDEEVSRALFKEVENWAHSEGMEGVHGPLGFTDFDPEGMLIEGFDELGTMPDIYNYSYYKDHIERYGYKKHVDWVEYEIRTPEEIPDKAKRISELAAKRNHLRLLEAKKSKDFLPYAREIFDVLDSAYSAMYGYVPMTKAQVDFYLKQYFSHIVPDYVKLVLDRNDAVAGVLIGFPSFSRALQKAKGRLFPFGFIYLLRALKKNKYLDLYLGAVRPDLQGKGVNAIFMAAITDTAIKKGIISTESTKELEENRLVRAHWDYYDVRQHKRRRCYIKCPL
jgi:GNAT superfamily N-acetyltransferase